MIDQERRIVATAAALYARFQTHSLHWDGLATDRQDQWIDHARAALAAADAVTAESHWLAPNEPTNNQMIGGLEWALAWMKQHGVDGLSPWADYPAPGETLKGAYRAMRDAYLASPVESEDRSTHADVN